MAYVVKRGDTLGAIARDNNMTLDELLDLNPDYRSNPNLIHVGDEINLGDGESGGDSKETANGPGGLGDTSKMELIKVPGEPKIWKVGDSYRIVYYIPGTEPPIPVTYTADKEAMEAIFGPDQDITWDKELTVAEFRNTGALKFGSHEELANLTSDPIDALMDQIEKEEAVRPWLSDQGVVAVLLEAILEGRTPSAAEFEQTDWWVNHSESERQWLLLNASDPSTAEQRRLDNLTTVRNMMIQAGIWEPDPALVEFVANKFTMGTWSQTILSDQISYLADPAGPSEGRAELIDFVSSNNLTVDTTAEGEDRVKQLVDQWLGPAFGTWTDTQIRDWAMRLRNDPDGESSLVEVLQQQRLTLFPEYDDPTKTYDDIAGGWRAVWTDMWGEVPDESDSRFIDIIRMNDLTEAQKLLRSEGLKDGNGKVMQDFVGGMAQQFSRTNR